METTLLYALLVVSSGVVGFVGCDVFRRFRFRRRARAMAVRAPRATVKVRCSPRGRPDGPCTLMHTHVMLGLPDGHFASCYDDLARSAGLALFRRENESAREHHGLR